MWPRRPASIGEKLIALELEEGDDELMLEDGARIAVVGGGPAGSLFSLLFLKMADTIGIEASVVIYEPRQFIHKGPAGCNHCGGIVSEFLVQLLSTEGIRLPATVVQRGIDSYVLHMDVGSVRIDTPLYEQRIAAVYRGNGPRFSEPIDVSSFDRYLQDLAASRGASIRRKLVSGIRWRGDRPYVESPDGSSKPYDLVVVAAGINSNLLQNIEGLEFGYEVPETVRTFICEFYLGRDTIAEHLGSSMHVFLLDIPHLEFAAIIPKGDYVTMVMLGDEIDEDLVSAFLSAPEVKGRFPEAVVPRPVCHCFPRINMKLRGQPFTDRIVLVGDSGVTRLYKDGIGAAYRTAKAAARTAVFSGVSAKAFEENYWPALKTIDFDNSIGKVMFTVSHAFQKIRFTRRGMLRMVAREQKKEGSQRRMSGVLWDLFTGSAPYRDILMRTFHPGFMVGIGWNLVAGNMPFGNGRGGNGGGDGV